MSDKITKLSDAIRLGATFRPQCRRGTTDFDRRTSCALMAAHEAVFHQTPEEFLRGCRTFEPLADRFGLPSGIVNQVALRNDRDGHTREQIADWLEGQGL